ncbi:MAG: helix-turn-helix transcriptional regulator [Acidobacteriota bacterium]
MKLVADPREFQRAPIGSCVAGATYLIWCAAPDLAGSLQWGVTDDRDVREMIALMDFIRHPSLAPTGCVLMDCHDIERVDTDVMVGFIELAREWLPKWSPRIAAQAVIVPEGVAGILIAGALPLLAPTHRFRFASTLDDALAFLAHPGARAAHAEAAAIATTVRGTAALVARLRSAIAADLVDASLEACATQLAVSVRTLQRELARADTSFSDELRRARVAAASELLQLSDVKLEAIATRVGFGTSSRMNEALRRELGVTARELRDRARR